MNLIEGSILVQGCTLTGIPINYIVNNIPIDTPQVLFTTSAGTNNIGLCATSTTLSLVTSKGFTKRNVAVTWAIITLTPANDNLKEAL